MKKKILVPLILLVLSGLPVFATVAIQGVNYYSSQTYNSATGFALAQNVTISHTGPADTYFVTVSAGGSGDPLARKASDASGNGMNYLLYSDTTTKTPLKDLSSNAAATDIFQGHFSGGTQTNTFTYYFAALAGLYPRSGYFSDTFTISLYTGTLKNWTFIASVNVQVAIQVNYEMNLSIVPSGGAFNQALTSLTFDFGLLTPGSTRTGDIVVMSNVPFRLTLSSMNGGVLRRTDQWENSQIPYTCTVNGSPVPLPANTASLLGQGLTDSTAGTRFPLVFTIGSFWDVTTGTFGDILQVTVSSL